MSAPDKERRDAHRAEGYDLAELRRESSGRAITRQMRDGEEIVYCENHDGEYIGWTPRERAERMGYTVSRTTRQEDILALIEVAEAAHGLRQLEREFDALPWQDRSAVAVDFCEAQIAARARLDAALVPFSAPDSTSSGAPADARSSGRGAGT